MCLLWRKVCLVLWGLVSFFCRFTMPHASASPVSHELGSIEYPAPHLLSTHLFKTSWSSLLKRSPNKAFQILSFLLYLHCIKCSFSSTGAILLPWNAVPIGWYKCLLFSITFTVRNSSLVAQTVKRLSTMRETRVLSLVWEDPWGKKWQSTLVL